MAYADYAPCEICDGKAVYDPDDVVRDDVIVVHRRCYPHIAAAALRDAAGELERRAAASGAGPAHYYDGIAHYYDGIARELRQRADRLEAGRD